jgi:hypothetical protein
MSSNDVEEKDKGGRPPEGIKFGQHKNAFGWDPTGIKGIKQDFKSGNQATTFQPNPKFKSRQTSVATTENITRNMKSKHRGIISETLNSDTHQDPDFGTMLDENNIL